jgi:hypothetical protein
MNETIQFSTGAEHSQHQAILWKSDGVYYCRLKVPGQSTPVTFALHGISTESEAAQALKTLQLQNAP